jgi:hypothetical protein
MQRYIRYAVLLALAVAVRGMAAGDARMSVTVRTGQLRATPSALGTPRQAVAYGDRVSVLTRRGAWFEVRTEAGASGWIHESALTKKTVVLTGGGADVSATASGSELALAGKGFNKEVEAKFRADNKDIDFTWVDRMETYRVTELQSVVFLREGGVQVPEGGTP